MVSVCDEGQGGKFVSGGRIEPGGSFPLNSHARFPARWPTRPHRTGTPDNRADLGIGCSRTANSAASGQCHPTGTDEMGRCPQTRSRTTQVTYLLGGTMSGPLRVSADLTKGVVEEARPPQGVVGDGHGYLPQTMSVTQTATLTPKQLSSIRQLAGQVAKVKPYSTPKCPGIPPGFPDAWTSLEVVAGGQSYDGGSVGRCATDEVNALTHVMLCASDPTRYGCDH